jgi:large subunit ribosomal protein L1
MSMMAFRFNLCCKYYKISYSIRSSKFSILVSAPKPEKKVRHNNKDYSKLEDFNIYDAIPKLKSSLWAKFDETIELSINTYLDPRKPNQSIKGVALLPHGNGKQVRVAVFATGQDLKTALDAGADVVGGEDLVAKIQAGDISFERAIGKNFIF